jgi:hypothetical protein
MTYGYGVCIKITHPRPCRGIYVHTLPSQSCRQSCVYRADTRFTDMAARMARHSLDCLYTDEKSSTFLHPAMHLQDPW